MSVANRLAPLKPVAYRATSLAQRVRAAVGLAPVRPPVGFVIERKDWAIRWYGTFIAEEANRLAPGTAWVTTDPSCLTSGVVMFGSQYQWVEWGPYLSPKCRFVSTFLHGKPEDGPDVARHIDRFLAALPRLDRVVCSASLVRDRLVSWARPPRSWSVSPDRRRDPALPCRR
ncbi:MAG: hypothetical protein HC829_00175, partial [Bacteroidales bacterium]|nr:hypothetical protein [Bacteroidales bacterium]